VDGRGRAVCDVAATSPQRGHIAEMKFHSGTAVLINARNSIQLNTPIN
jgi:hypothetical protein